MKIVERKIIFYLTMMLMAVAVRIYAMLMMRLRGIRVRDATAREKN